MNIEEMTMEDVQNEMRSIDFEAEGADLEALEARMEALKARETAIKAEAEEKRAELEAVAKEEITEPVVQENTTMEERKITTASPEYRDAFFAMIKGEATEEQRTTLINVDGDASTTGDAIALPKTLDTMIWDNIHEAHPILADITTIASGIVMEVTRHTAIATRVTGKKDAATGAGAEDNTFVKVTLSGVDYEKYVELTYAEAKMSNNALESYIASEISSELGEALAKDVFARILSDATSSQSETGTTDIFDDCKKVLAKVTQASRIVCYAPSAKYYEIVGAINANGGNPFNIANTLGFEIKMDNAATKVTFVDPSMFVLNQVQALTLESDKDVKKHHVVVSGYLRAEGCLRKTKAAGYIA